MKRSQTTLRQRRKHQTLTRCSAPTRRLNLDLVDYAYSAFHSARQKFQSTKALRAALSIRMANIAAKCNSSARGKCQLLVDVSTLASADAKTGIQRVSKAIVREWLMNPPKGFDVRPICASRWHPFRYCDPADFLETVRPRQKCCLANVNAGPDDIFLSLDLTAHILPHHHLQLEQWKIAGAKIFFVVYDLLPTLKPEWFTDKGVSAQKRWLRTLAIYADGAACISRTVANDLDTWLTDTLGHFPPGFKTCTFPLGSDILGRAPAIIRGIDFAAQGTGNTRLRTVLMVGTVEPRKGYALALSAFEHLWAESANISLAIIGKAGWQVESLVGRLRSHPEMGRKLIWIENGDDEVLCALYETCIGLLAASEGEGYGLPIVEAAHFGLPVLARDLPVFREIAGDSATYFDETQPENLAHIISCWVDSIDHGTVVRPDGTMLFSWEESARELWATISADNLDIYGGVKLK